MAYRYDMAASYPPFDAQLAKLGATWNEATKLYEAGKISKEEKDKIQLNAHEAADHIREIVAKNLVGRTETSKKVKGFLDTTKSLVNALNKEGKIPDDSNNFMTKSVNSVKVDIIKYEVTSSRKARATADLKTYPGEGEAWGSGQIELEPDGDFLPNLYADGIPSNFSVDIINQYDIYKLRNSNMDMAERGFSYVFFTTPNLNLSEENVATDSFFSEMFKREPDLINSLTTDTKKFSPFIKLLTNCSEDFSPSDTVLKTKELAETLAGFKLLLPSLMTDSIVANQFTINYTERRDLPITKIHKLWVDYMEFVRRGLMLSSNYSIKNRIFDYFSSVYYFTLEPDGQTIQYYCKYTGVAPIAVPYSAFNYNRGEIGEVKLNIPYIWSYKEDMNPDILSDFNKVTSKSPEHLLDFSIKPKGQSKTSFYNEGKIYEVGGGTLQQTIFGTDNPIGKNVRIVKSLATTRPEDRFKYKLVFF
jgi:hypothetical protein